MRSGPLDPGRPGRPGQDPRTADEHDTEVVVMGDGDGTKGVNGFEVPDRAQEPERVVRPEPIYRAEGADRAERAERRERTRDVPPRLPALNGPAVAESLPGLARVAGSAALHTASWGVRTTTRNWLRVGRAVTNREEANALIRDVGTYVGALGEVARQVSDGLPVATALLRAGETLGGAAARPAPLPAPSADAAPGPSSSGRAPSLRDRGNDLLARSRDVWSQDDRHPAYDRILDELAPDEARILVMLLRDGPQPSVDIRTGGPIGMVSSQLVASGLNMIGARAGLRYLDQVPSYLNNLFRLGLVWLSREAVQEHQEYQVLEAQPDVLAALHSVKFAKVVRRSIHLTPFGEEFCKLALVDEATATSDLPEHEMPPEIDSGS